MSAHSLISDLAAWVWRASWQASLLAALVWLVQSILRRKLTPNGRSVLWLVVVLRLILPILPPSAFSVFNLVPQKSTQVEPLKTAAVAPVPIQIPAAVSESPKV